MLKINLYCIRACLIIKLYTHICPQDPGLAPEVQYVPPTIGERAVGVGEGGLNVLTGLAGGVFGGTICYIS